MQPMPHDPATERPIPGSVLSVPILGIPVRLHFTFVLLFAFLIFVGISSRQSIWADIIYIGAIFGSVILHELGHALTARRYGVKTVEIVMFPIGGVARLNRNPGVREEFWIAAAGPAVNFVIAGALFAYLMFRNGVLPLEALSVAADHTLAQRVATGNLILGLFNLLPAFPMDGGRILRSLLARRRPEEQATQMAARAGRVLAVLMGLYGLLVMNFFLVFIAFFVYLGAAQEGVAAQGRSLTQGQPVRSAMITDFRTLPHGSTLRDAADLLLSTSQQDFPVMHGEEVIGLLTRNGLVRALSESGTDAYVSQGMARDFTRISPEAALSEAFPALARAGSCVLVMDGPRLVGLLTTDNLAEFLLLRRFGVAGGSTERIPHAA